MNRWMSIFVFVFFSCSMTSHSVDAGSIHVEKTRKQSVTFLYRGDVSAIMDVKLKSGGHQELLFMKDGIYDQQGKKLMDYPSKFESVRAAYENVLDQIVERVAVEK